MDDMGEGGGIKRPGGYLAAAMALRAFTKLARSGLKQVQQQTGGSWLTAPAFFGHARAESINTGKQRQQLINRQKDTDKDTKTQRQGDS